MKKIFLLFQIFIGMNIMTANALELSIKYLPVKSRSNLTEGEWLSLMSKDLKLKIEFDLADHKLYSQTQGLPTHDEIKFRLLSYIRVLGNSTGLNIGGLEEKIFTTILKENDALLELWSFIAVLYIERGHNLDTLMALLESRSDMTIPIKSKILSKLIHFPGINNIMTPYIIGLISKGEFQFIEISKIIAHLKQEFLEPRDWLVLIDQTFSKPVKIESLREIEQNDGMAHLSHLSYLRYLKSIFICDYYGDRLSHNEFMSSSQTLLKFHKYKKFKSLVAYPAARTNMYQVIAKTNRPFETDIAIIEHLFQRFAHEMDIRSHLMNHWLSYIHNSETKLSMNQVCVLMQKSHDMGNLPLATNLSRWVNQLTKQPPRVKPIISFVASQENSENLDYFRGNQYPSLSLLIPELQSRGYLVEVLSWEDSTINWSTRECLFIPHVWGYTKKQTAFYEWLDKIKSLKIPLVNSMEFVEWDINKNYLDDLQKAKIPVIPTMIVPKHSTQNFADILNKAQKLWDTKNIIAKGVCDAGGNGYKKYKPGQEMDIEDHIEKLKKEFGGAVIQPFWPEVTEKGELSFVFIGKALSHSYLKVCAPESELVQVLYKGRSYHINKDDLSSKSREFFKELKEFRPDLKITLEELVLVHGQVYRLFSTLNRFFAYKAIPMPPIFRLDCVIRDKQLYIMEVEGIPYLEMKEANYHDAEKNIVEWYVDEILRQLSINKV